MVSILALTGLFLIFLEFFLPGAIMAIGGAILLLSSLLLFYSRGATLLSLFGYAALLALFVYLIIRFALLRVRKGRVCLETDQEGFQACVYPKEMVGKRALVASDLKPSGYIEIEQLPFSALSKSGYIEKGTEVQIIGGEGAHLLVTRIGSS